MLPRNLTIPLLLSTLAAAAAAQIVPGNLVVLRIGDGVNPLSNAAQALFLDEYTTSGTLVQSIALPTTASGSHQPVTCSGTATSEGNLQLAENGQYLVLAGYSAAPGLASVASTASIATPRVIARIGLDEVVDTSTTITNAFSGNNIRSATSTDGTQFWAAGANSGVNHVLLGGSSAVALNSTTPLNVRTVQIHGGQLYCSSSSSGFYYVHPVGTGIPTTSGQTVAVLPGFGTTSGPSSYDFFFADANTLYIADDRSSGGLGGIYKYAFAAGSWSLQYQLSAGPTTGLRGLTGTVQGGTATLFATTTLLSTNHVLAVTDTGPTSTFTTLATAATNTVFRGLRLIPGSPYVRRIPHGCGPMAISGTGDASLGSTFTTTLANATGLPFLGFGFALVPSPLCASCTIGHEWAVALFAASNAFAVPSNPAYLGVTIGIQGADLLGTGGCAAPPVALTDTLSITLN